MRQDFYLYNDGAGWSVVASDAINEIVEDARKHDEHFVFAHKLALFDLEGEDNSVVRVVVNEELSETETEEWIARARWRLKIKGGQVLICGGFDHDSLNAWQEEGNSPEVHAQNIPPGDYQVTLYTYLHSMNGSMWLDRNIHPSVLPELSAWFRKDHEDEPLPSWVAAMFAYEDLNENDEWYPIQERVKSGSIIIEQQSLYWIGYLIHLIPFTPEMELDQPGADGWFEAKTGLRIPERCPLGVSTDCTEDRDIADKLDWVLGRS